MLATPQPACAAALELLNAVNPPCTSRNSSRTTMAPRPDGLPAACETFRGIIKWRSRAAAMNASGADPGKRL